MKLEERIFLSREERLWGIAGVINHKYSLYLKNMTSSQKIKLAFLFYLNALRNSQTNIAYLEYIRVGPPFNFDNNLEKKIEEARRKNEIIGEYIKSEHSLDLGKREGNITRSLHYSAGEVRKAIHKHLRGDFIKKYLEDGIKVKSYASSEGISKNTLYKLLGKGKMNEIREKRKEFIYKRFKSEIFDNFNLRITDFCYKYKISTSTLYKMIRERGDNITKLRDGRSYYAREDKFRVSLENKGFKRCYRWVKNIVNIKKTLLSYHTS